MLQSNKEQKKMYLFGEVSVGEMSVGDVSSRGRVRRGCVWLEEVSIGEMSVGDVSRQGNVRWGNVRRGSVRTPLANAIVLGEGEYLYW